MQEDEHSELPEIHLEKGQDDNSAINEIPLEIDQETENLFLLKVIMKRKIINKYFLK